MDTPRLTIGMATYDDFEGTWWTIQDLRMFHSEDLDDCEIVIIDNHPQSTQGQMVKALVENWMQGGKFPTRYIAAGEYAGTQQPRNRLFAEAKGEFVLCMDCHVMVPPRTIQRFLGWMTENPESSDILSGPLYYDNLVRPGSDGDSQSAASLVTHYDDVWRGENWGIWGVDPRGLDVDADPFEIPAMGVGMFACRREAWLGFNEHTRGFGADEFCIHEKFRHAGHKAMCLPFMRWLHRFGRPGGVPYPLTQWNKVRNYVLALNELDIPLDRVYSHFVKGIGEPVPDGSPPGHPNVKMTQSDWDYLIEDPVAHVMPKPVPPSAKQGCGSCDIPAADNLDAMYLRASGTVSDINEHVPKLRELAEKVDHVTEFGTRNGVSTVALLSGQPETLLTYDRSAATQPGALEEHAGKTDTRAVRENALEVDIEETDLLFIDTRHTEAQLTAELGKHAGSVRRFIALHDTEIYGEHGEDGGPGLLPAMRKFLKVNQEWSVIYHARNNHGFTVLGRLPEDKPKLPSLIKMAGNFAKAIAAHVADGASKASPESLTSRLEVCSLCDQRNVNNCSICGCNVAAKAALFTSECPIGKWKEQNVSRQE